MGCCCSQLTIRSHHLREWAPPSAAELPVFAPSATSGGSFPGGAVEGSTTVTIASSNYELRYASLSQRGLYPDALDKVNQDSLCIHASGSDDIFFFGVFDGHGEFGAQCSQFAGTRLRENLFASSQLLANPVQALHAAFIATNAQLREGSIDDTVSGTTAISVLLRGTLLYIANAGDSRAVVAERRENGALAAVDLSIDQTPFREDELQRVKMCGARVLTLDQIEGLKDPAVKCWGTVEGDDGGDPPRVWAPNGMLPGTAFTRSIGDAVAESIGVIADPEIVTFELTERHPFLVLASDGVFEFMSSQDVVDMIAKYNEPHEACAAVVAESYRLWLHYETRTDDITLIVVYISGLTATDYKKSAPRVELPSAFGRNTGNHPARHEVSAARMRSIESSLQSKNSWGSPSPLHKKPWGEEVARIEKSLHDHFLFNNLSDSQYHILLDCMNKIEVEPGDVVLKQGGVGDCFYVVGSGEFEALAEEGGVVRVVQKYAAEKLSCFGELAIMYNKPVQASVRAVTRGALWALKREDFLGVVMSEFVNISSLKLLRSVHLLSQLTILQLSHIAESLTEVSYSDGEIIVDEEVSSMYLINKGKVKITFDNELLTNDKLGSLKSGTHQKDEVSSSNTASLVKSEGSYFGEWALGGQGCSIKAVAVGNCTCSILSKANFHSIVGPSASILNEQENRSVFSFTQECNENTELLVSSKISISELEWKTCVYTTDCSEIGLVTVKSSGHVLSLKRFCKRLIRSSEKEAQILKERDLLRSISKSSFVPEIFSTYTDENFAYILLNAFLACPLSSILHSPLDESAAKFCGASAVLALEDLHNSGILYRGISPDILMLDKAGHLKLVDFRFAKKMTSERTFTICGMGDSSAPELISGSGHSFPADWWALGVLIYYMLQGEMPFGNWREKELETIRKIAKGSLSFPPTFSSDAIDLIKKLVEVNERERLGCQAVKGHPWFRGIEWGEIRDGRFGVPHQITIRIADHLSERAAHAAFLDVPQGDDSAASEFLRHW